MQKYNKASISYVLLIFMLIFVSCSKESNEMSEPEYTGSWERKWMDTVFEVQFIQILEIKEDRFVSTIQPGKGNLLNPVIKFEGKQKVIDRTFEVWIEKLSKTGPGNEIIQLDAAADDFDKIVFETLTIHSRFFGFFTLRNDVLELALDFNGDSIAGGNEGAVIFYRTEN